MARPGWLLWVTFALAAVGFATFMVAAVDGEYVGWFHIHGGSNHLRAGWKGTTSCDADYEHCVGETNSYSSSSGVVDGMKAALAFAILAVLVTFPVLLSTFLIALGRGALVPPPARIALSCVAFALASLSWTIAVGRVYDQVDHSSLDFDHNPPLLIVGSIFLLIVAWLSREA